MINIRSKKIFYAWPFLSALLLWLSYHPANFNFLVWVALVPWFFYIDREEKKKRLVVIVWLSAFVFFLLAMGWLRHVTWPGLFVISFFLAGYFALFAWLVKLIRNRFGQVIFLWSLPLLWVGLEYVRSFLFTGFPWFFLGHTQYQWLVFIQIVDLAGVYAVSFIILMINVFITLVIIKMRESKINFILQDRNAVAMGLFIIVLFVFAQVYGLIRLKTIKLKAGPKVGIVQGNIEQGIKVSGSRELIYEKHRALTEKLARQDRPDLIVWPETMYPYSLGFNRVDPDENEALMIFKERLQATARSVAIPMLVGDITLEIDEQQQRDIYNSAYYLDGDGTILGRYDKMHLVPFSEAPTLRNISPALERLALKFTSLNEFFNITAGQNITSLSLAGRKFGVLICYESIFSDLVRANVERGNDFIINVSNDGWFKNSSELDQILAMTVFRCVEHKISIIRATNTGISAFVEPTGALNICRNEQGVSKGVAGVWAQQISVGGERTFYTRFGDFFPLACWLILMAIIIVKLLKLT